MASFGAPWQQTSRAAIALLSTRTWASLPTRREMEVPQPGRRVQHGCICKPSLLRFLGRWCTPGQKPQHQRERVAARCGTIGHTEQHRPQQLQRRALLLGSLALPALLSAKLRPQELWSIAELPAGYQDFAGKLVAALREAIETDLSDAEEREVRRKAEPAKDLVKTWIQTWRDAPGIKSEVSHAQLTGTIKELGEFYKQKGQRARLPRALADDLLAKLSAAENALPLNAGKQRV